MSDGLLSFFLNESDELFLASFRCVSLVEEDLTIGGCCSFSEDEELFFISVCGVVIGVFVSSFSSSSFLFSSFSEDEELFFVSVFDDGVEIGDFVSFLFSSFSEVDELFFISVDFVVTGFSSFFLISLFSVSGSTIVFCSCCTGSSDLSFFFLSLLFFSLPSLLFFSLLFFSDLSFFFLSLELLSLFFSILDVSALELIFVLSLLFSVLALLLSLFFSFESPFFDFFSFFFFLSFFLSSDSDIDDGSV